MTESGACPLCGSSQTSRFFEERSRSYERCEECGLVFVPPRFHLAPEEEKRVYDMHENDPSDPAYRRFLSRLLEPVQQRLPAEACGLDFGSGPGPTLSVMFEEQGCRMRIYDPFYAPDATVLEGQYDFITMTEVAEHLHRPGVELQRLWSLLRPGGWLGIMTKRVENARAFASWHYKNDPTHVAFFSERTFSWLAGRWGTEALFPQRDVVLFEKPGEIG